MLHLPIGGHSPISMPGVLQTAPVMLQTPGTFGHGTAELQVAWVLEQVWILEQQNCVWPWLQAVA
jgi:hypothetical protein